MEQMIQQFDLHSNSESFEDNMESFELWSMTKKYVRDDKTVAI